MQIDSPYAPPTTPVSIVAPRPGRWFAGGFAVMFLGPLMLLKMHYFTGTGLVSCWLWEFYLLEFRRALNPSPFLGPTSDASGQALQVLLTHLVASAIVGGLALAIGTWTLRRMIRNR